MQNAEIPASTLKKWYESRKMCQYCLSTGPKHSGVCSAGTCLSSGLTSASYLWTVPEMVKCSQTLYQAEASCRGISDHHTGAMRPKKTSTRRYYCWKQAVYMNSHFDESTPKLGSAIVSIETHMLVQ